MADKLATDVVVVGAGLAGLVAAAAIRKADRSVLVLEARDRVGGRLLNGTLETGETVELGGEWIGPTQDRMYELVRELGLETFPSHTTGKNLLDLDGKRQTYSGTIPRVAPHVLVDVGLAQLKISRLVNRIDPARPWDAAKAKRLDSETMASWINRNIRTVAGRKMFAIAGKTVWGAEPEDISLLFALAYAKAGGSFNMLIDVEGGAQQDRIVGGSQSIALRMAEALGESVRLDTPVRRIVRSDRGVTVVGDGSTVEARAVVVAIPPPLAARIDYSPELPAARDQLTQRMYQGSLAKCMAVYDEPFWRADGLSGESLTDHGPVSLTFDNAPPGGRPGVMLGFVGGREARGFELLTAAERRQAVLDVFVRLYGERAAKPREYLEQDWTNELWSGGGPTSLMAPGTLTSYGRALREPVGCIHWAGTETATKWCGYMEGAVLSGERAAAEILAELS